MNGSLPPHVLKALGGFDLDPCSPINRPWPTAAKHYTIQDDGLTKPWEGRVFCNPPYGSETGRWLARLADHGVGTALVFGRTETEWFQGVWQSATAILFLAGRLTFHTVNGQPAAFNSGAPSVLIAYGDEDAKALLCSKLPGAFVALRGKYCGPVEMLG